MKQRTAPASFAERAGRALGRTWRGFLRLDGKAQNWLVAQGMNATLAQGILWAVRLVLLAVLLYGAFWVALVLGFAFVGAWAARYADFELPQLEWRDGMLGFGLYHPDGSRIDPHDPDEDL
ncbi:MAG: DUF3742 family protein [Candidatus Accumulibacter sp.]|nr:DUF3742 family protein [Accumulibacter sp.]